MNPKHDLKLFFEDILSGLGREPGEQHRGQAEAVAELSFVLDVSAKESVPQFSQNRFERVLDQQ
jgi:hypothetical protein